MNIAYSRNERLHGLGPGLKAARMRRNWAEVRDVRNVRWLGLALTLLVAHVTLAVQAGASVAAGPQSVAIGMQAVAVAAVLTRWRRSVGEARQLWLLLALAVLLQMFWGVWNLFGGLMGGSLGSALDMLAVVFSGLYMVPCMFMIARSFHPDAPRMAWVLDTLLSLCVIGLLYVLIHHVMTAAPGVQKNGIQTLIYHADAVDFSLAVLATMRLVGSRTRMRRHAYFAATAFLWLNAISASTYNRLELGGLPWWAGVMLDVAFVAVIVCALYPLPRSLRSFLPARRVTEVVDGFAPIVLSIGVLSLGISVSRQSFLAGMVVSVLAVVFYGMRTAYIQSRDRYRQHEAALSNQRLQQQLGTDPLTGIANRVALDVHMREALMGERRGSGSCSVLMVDIDYFKQYNDSFGHIAGDACLVRVVDALRASLLRSGDRIARYGGEEFAVVLPDSSEAAAQRVGRRLVEAVADLELAHPTSPYGVVTVSVGLVSCDSCAPDQAMRLLELADRALYRAKRQGRNCCEVFRQATYASGAAVTNGVG